MMIDALIATDRQQRLLALDSSQSFIVQAPAGSGKTELLIQRFLTLLNTVKAPEEILAITFTKKAANEMRARVLKALKHALHEPEPESAHAKQTWLLAKQVLQRDQQLQWHLINNPNQLRIQTIDSLCSFLTRQLPMLSHFGAQPAIADNPIYLYRLAVMEVLAHVEENFEWSQAISQLLLHLDNDLNKLHNLLVNLLAKRDQWLPYIHLNSNDADIKRQLERHLAMVINDNLKALHAIFPNSITTDLLAILRYAADNLALSEPDADIHLCRDLTCLPDTTPAAKSSWAAIANFLLTGKGEWRKSFTKADGMPAASGLKNAAEKQLAENYKQRLLDLMKCLHDRDDLRLALYELRYLPEPHYQPAQWEALQSLLHVLKIVAAQLRVTFQQYGQIDFIQNAQAALTALGDDDSPTDLALALDYQIRHLLVDEFQDTSLSQYQLLEKLITGWENNDGRSLFVVGDPMQSIYRFREAEVGLFIRMRTQGIGNIKLIPITLAVNFRSHANIVNWNNQHFEKIFPSYNNMATGAVTYSHSAANKADPDADAKISIQGFIDTTAQTQAEQVVKLVSTTIEQYPEEKIAILVRSRPHLKEVIPALKKANIPYRAIDIDPLATRPHIQDLLALTCALIHPADRIAWLALLRAPWCGLALADLLIIAGDNPYGCIWDALLRDDLIKKLSTSGQQRLQQILPILKTKLAEREREDLRAWIENTWLLLGGPACLEDYSEIDDANSYFTLLDKFSQQDQTLHLDKLKEKINELYAAGKHEDDKVQIMTIHSAKGLEFDTVILPRLEKKPANDDTSLLLWMERPLTNDHVALLLAPIHATGTDKDYIYEYVHRQQKIKSDFEIDRLFYVATTRAKKRLHLFFDTEKTAKGEFKSEPGSFLKKLMPLLVNRESEIFSSEHVNPHIDLATQPAARAIKRLTKLWTNPINHIATAKVATHIKSGGFQLIDTQPKIVGIVTHRTLQQIAESGVAWWQTQSEKDRSNYIKFQLLQLGIMQNQLASAAKSVLIAIANVLGDDRGLWILQQHNDGKAEYAITAVIDGCAQSLVIDRTFIDEHGTRWIIDYKTADDDQLEHATFLANEEEKYREQMYKYAEAMKLAEDRPIRLGLYFPALPAWREVKT